MTTTFSEDDMIVFANYALKIGAPFVTKDHLENWKLLPRDEGGTTFKDKHGRIQITDSNGTIIGSQG